MTVRHKTRFVARYGQKEARTEKGFFLKLEVDVDKELLLQKVLGSPESVMEKFFRYLDNYKEGKSSVTLYFFKFAPTASVHTVLDDFVWRGLRPANILDLGVIPSHPQLKRRVVVAPAEVYKSGGQSLVFGDEHAAIDFRGKEGPKIVCVNTVTGSTVHKRYLCYMAIQY